MSRAAVALVVVALALLGALGLEACFFDYPTVRQGTGGAGGGAGAGGTGGVAGGGGGP
ncbi:MAG: hypothetical protein U0271_06695 [Polyangiaceae bacterium]